ncbi:MAG: TolC family protein [Elusimicrobia bacterium]|nr:TolC family protein [Elusimicrobiota bacterium]
MRKVLLGIGVALAPGPASGQAPGPPPALDVLRLSLKDAVRAALSPGGSSRLREAEESVRADQAQADESRAALLPKAGGSVAGENQKVNLGALGLDASLPPTAELHVYKARLSARGELAAGDLKRWRAAQAGARASQNELDRVQDGVAAEVAGLYLAGLRGGALVREAQENAGTARALLDLARHRADAGKGTALDVTRAHAELMAREEELAGAEIERARARLRLLKAMGARLDARLELEDEQDAADAAEMSLEEALAAGLSSRPELRAQGERARQARMLRAAFQWERLPSLALYGDYGPEGTRLDGLVNTHVVGAALRLPFFGDGRLRAREQRGRAELEQAQARLDDLRAQVELEVREAAESLTLAAKRADAAQGRLALSRQELEQARRRYEAGVTGNLEVVEAQARLAQAERRRTDALFDRRKARLALWLAAGVLRARLR